MTLKEKLQLMMQTQGNKKTPSLGSYLKENILKTLQKKSPKGFIVISIGGQKKTYLPKRKQSSQHH